jgi:hypothetical protein
VGDEHPTDLLKCGLESMTRSKPLQYVQNTSLRFLSTFWLSSAQVKTVCFPFFDDVLADTKRVGILFK